MQTNQKGVLFDLDGTLANTISDITAAINAALAAERVEPVGDEVAMAMVGRGLLNALRGVLAYRYHPVTEARLQELYAVMIGYYSAHLCVHTKPYPGITGLLQGLEEEGIPFGVLSNKADVLVQDIMAHLFPDVRFSFIAGMRDGFPRKPDPAAFHLFSEWVGIGKEHILYVGDSEVDYAFAKAVGCPCALVSWGFRSLKELERMDSTIICGTITMLEERIHAI